jgi:hypothetical protein
MTSQLNYLIAQQRHIEFAYRAEQARLAGQARAVVSAPSRRWNLGRLSAPRGLRAVSLATAATRARSAPPQQCLRCDT